MSGKETHISHQDMVEARVGMLGCGYMGAVALELGHSLGFMLDNLLELTTAVFDKLESDFPEAYEELNGFRVEMQAWVGSFGEVVKRVCACKGLEEGDIKSTFEPLGAHGLLDEAVRMVGLPERIKVVKEYAASQPKILGNAGIVKLIFLNFLRNAVQAIEEAGGEGTITLVTFVYPEGDFVGINISDTGAGISPAAKEHLFQIGGSTKKGKLGVGLAASLLTIYMHDGTVHYRTALGEGTTFMLVFPAA